MTKVGKIEIPGFQHISPQKGSGEITFVGVINGVTCNVRIAAKPGYEMEVFNHLKSSLEEA